MAITVRGVDSGISLSTSDHAQPRLTLSIPTVQAGDLLHLCVNGPHPATPPNLVISPGWEQITYNLWRRIATGDPADTTVQVFVHSAGWNDLPVSAALIAHAGVDTVLGPYDAPPSGPYTVPQTDTARLVAFMSVNWLGPVDELPPGTPLNPWLDPTPPGTGAQPAWHPLTQTLSSTAVDAQNPNLTRGLQVGVFDADTFTPGQMAYSPALPPAPPGVIGSNSAPLSVFSLLALGASTGLDAPPSPDQLGVTGSGVVVPEWLGREQKIHNPLDTLILVDSGGQLTPPLESSPQAIMIDASFNGLGACTKATAAFAVDPKVRPFEQAMQFTLDADRPDAPAPWWLGVVQNTRFEGGLHLVDLVGLWELANEGPVTTDETGRYVQLPDHLTLAGVLTLSAGSLAALVLPDAAAAQQQWGQTLNNRFARYPNAAWGVGPDRMFVQGLPENGGYVDLSADHSSVLSVQAGDFILPPFVTHWWAPSGSGVVTAEREDPISLLTPLRTVQSRLTEGAGELVTPMEASMPMSEGPAHTLVFAGIVIPPVRIVNLPTVGSQMVASARVQVTLGEEGSMPRVTTTLTTVALPFRRAD